MNREECLMFIRQNSYMKYLLHNNGGELIITPSLFTEIQRLYELYDFLEKVDTETGNIRLCLQEKSERGESPVSVKAKYNM